MSRFRDLTGKEFGRLLVIERSPFNDTSNGAMWVCKCSCGITKSIAASNLLSGNTLSCGCVFKEKLAARNTLLALEPWLVDMNIYIRRVGYRKKRAKLGSNQFKSEGSDLQHPTLLLPWELNLEGYKKLVTSPCFYCGSPPSGFPNGALLKRTTLRRNGIDRIDNTKGYTTDNCVSCCKLCNFDKRAQTMSDFIQLTCKRYEHLLSKGLIPTK